jgi:hypothetical protein
VSDRRNEAPPPVGSFVQLTSGPAAPTAVGLSPVPPGPRSASSGLRPPEHPESGGRPSFKTAEDVLAWTLTEIGAVLNGILRARLAQVSPTDVPILEAHRARRTIEILAEQVARACPNPAHQLEPFEGDIAEAIAEATKRAATEIPIAYRSEP